MEPTKVAADAAVVETTGEEIKEAKESEKVDLLERVTRAKKVMGAAMGPGNTAVVYWEPQGDLALADVQSPSSDVLEVYIGDEKFPTQKGQALGTQPPWVGRIVREGTRLGALVRNRTGTLVGAEAAFWFAQLGDKNPAPSPMAGGPKPVQGGKVVPPPIAPAAIKAKVSGSLGYSGSGSNGAEADRQRASQMRDQRLIQTKRTAPVTVVLTRNDAETLLKVCKGTGMHPGQLSTVAKTLELALRAETPEVTAENGAVP